MGRLSCTHGSRVGKNQHQLIGLCVLRWITGMSFEVSQEQGNTILEEFCSYSIKLHETALFVCEKLLSFQEKVDP